MKRAVLYLRVSTLDQTTANQDRELRQVAERAGWQIVHVYKDHGISGAKGKDKRPAFDALHKAAARRSAKPELSKNRVGSSQWNKKLRAGFSFEKQSLEAHMARGILLWLLGIPIPVIIILLLIFHH
jgi:hypothetical protein